MQQETNLGVVESGQPHKLSKMSLFNSSSNAEKRGFEAFKRIEELMSDTFPDNNDSWIPATPQTQNGQININLKLYNGNEISYSGSLYNSIYSIKQFVCNTLQFKGKLIYIKI
jgi:hypothetical protein